MTNSILIRRRFGRRLQAELLAVGLTLASLLQAAAPPKPPQVGEIAPTFALSTIEGSSVEFQTLVKNQPVVLVVLRGWPGYQCPLCTRQVQDFVAKAADFRQRGVRVVMVYPGPAEQLKAKAGEFLRDKNWPADFVFLLDPDYRFTNAYGLRWDAKKETAYPSTFVLEPGGKVRFALVSRTHGDRLNATKALAELP